MAFGIDDAIAAATVKTPLPTKVCRVCKIEKTIDNFYMRAETKRYKTECVACKAIAHREYYVTRYAETAKRKAFEFRQKDQKLALLGSCKATARKKNIDFNLTAEDIVIPEFCRYLGVRLTNIQGIGHVDTNASVDRIDPKKGYIKGNVQIICFKANTMKRNASAEELRVFCKNILEHFGGV
jgi:hypothetical protein